MQPRNGDRVSIAAAHVNDRRVGRNRRNARLGFAVFQVQMHAGRVLEPAQALRLVRDDALRLLLVVRPAGHNFGPEARCGGPVHVNAGIHAHVFEVVARAARALAVKHAVLGVHHNVGDVEPDGRNGRGVRGRHQLVRIHVVVRRWRRVRRDRGVAQRRDGKVRLRVIGDREVAVVHVAVGGTECGGQVAGRRRREQVLALGDVQQLVVTGRAGDRGGRGLHGAHVFGPVRLCERAAVLR